MTESLECSRAQISWGVCTLKVHLRHFPSSLQLLPVIVEPPQTHHCTLKTVPVERTQTVVTISCYLARYSFV